MHCIPQVYYSNIATPQSQQVRKTEFYAQKNNLNPSDHAYSNLLSQYQLANFIHPEMCALQTCSRLEWFPFYSCFVVELDIGWSFETSS
jgi:hypothetical protein